MSKKARKTKKKLQKKSRKKTKKQKAGKKAKKKKKITFKDELREFISLSKKDIEVLRIEHDDEKTFRCPQCGRFLVKGTEECPCGVKFIEELYEPKAEVTDFFKYLYKPEKVPVPELKKELPLPPPPPSMAKKPKPRKPKEPEEPKKPEPTVLEEPVPEVPKEPEEPEPKELEEPTLEKPEELALEELALKVPEEPEKKEVERPPREMVSLMDVPDELKAVVKVSPPREELSLVDAPGQAEVAEKAAERRFLFRRVSRDRKLFYTGVIMILIGGPVVALSSWYHDWFRVPLVGDTYEAFGWLNEFAVMIGIVLLIIGVIFFTVSLRGGAITNKEFKKLKSEG